MVCLHWQRMIRTPIPRPRLIKVGSILMCRSVYTSLCKRLLPIHVPIPLDFKPTLFSGFGLCIGSSFGQCKHTTWAHSLRTKAKIFTFCPCEWALKICWCISVTGFFVRSRRDDGPFGAGVWRGWLFKERDIHLQQGSEHGKNLSEININK